MDDKSTNPDMLVVEQLSKHFPVRGELLQSLFAQTRAVRAVDGISLSIRREETFGLVGESGSGKSTTGKLIARLLEPSAGRISLDGMDWLALSARKLRRARRDVQMIFQNPFSSLDPRWTVARIIAEPLLTHQVVEPTRIKRRVAELLLSVGLDPSHAARYPHQFSGGQRQRIGLARALALNPKILIADEPVSALDVSVQAQILNLLRKLQQQHHLSMLFISHDLSVVKYVCDRVAVMYLGKIVEIAVTDTLFRAPAHPYSAALLAAIPQPSARPKPLTLLEGEIPSPINPPSGCRFHPRCPHAESVCAREEPVFRELDSGHMAACHFPINGVSSRRNAGC